MNFSLISAIQSTNGASPVLSCSQFQFITRRALWCIALVICIALFNVWSNTLVISHSASLPLCYSYRYNRWNLASTRSQFRPFNDRLIIQVYCLSFRVSIKLILLMNMYEFESSNQLKFRYFFSFFSFPVSICKNKMSNHPWEEKFNS